MTTTAAPDARIAPFPLWRSAGAFITTLFNLFGAPQDLAADHTLTTKTHALILSWLRVAEAFMRQLLLIEASALDCNAGPASRGQHRSRKRHRFEFHAHEPENWRVTFRCISSSPARGGSPEQSEGKGDVARNTHKRFHSAWPIAERFEALLRVYNDPAPYARRLARRLQALPRLIARLLQTPTDFEHRIDDDTRFELSALIAPIKRNSS